MRDETLAGVLRFRGPDRPRVPLVFDSPHSGTIYPDDFRHVAPLQALRRAEDTHVDELYGAAPDQGCVLLAALFPRSYVDPNRNTLDQDPDLLDGPWPEPLSPSSRSLSGRGLIWSGYPPGLPLYDRKLPVEEVRQRIERYHAPYHASLQQELDGAYGAFGSVWHVNCHSMPSVSTKMSPEGPGVVRPDITLGDRDGTTCAPAFTAFVRDYFAGRGYSVTINDPYKGAYLLSACSNPDGARHSLMIELNRRLYMDEETLEKNAGFARLQEELTGLITALAGFARGQLDEV
jgi:N-formylglutamate amidohydrolase